MYAIYEKLSYKLEDFEVGSDPLSEDLFGMNEAEELIREIREKEPEYFDYIKNLPDGIRAAKNSNEPANFIFCEAGDYQKIFLADKNDNLIKTDIITAINITDKVIHVTKILIGLQEIEVAPKIELTQETEVITVIQHVTEVITAMQQEQEIRIMADHITRVDQPDIDSNFLQ